MRFLTLTGIAVSILLLLIVIALLTLILSTIKNKFKELITFMTEQERLLNEQLDRQNAALTSVGSGITELKTLTAALREEIRILSENNPDLSDEIARATELADQAEALASSMVDNPDIPTDPETPVDPEVPTDGETPGDGNGEPTDGGDDGDTGELPSGGDSTDGDETGDGGDSTDNSEEGGL